MYFGDYKYKAQRISKTTIYQAMQPFFLGCNDRCDYFLRLPPFLFGVIQGQALGADKKPDRFVGNFPI